MDAISINNVLWIVVIDKYGHLVLERAKERRENMTSEKRQEKRDKDKGYQKTKSQKRAREGKPLGNACSLSGNSKARQALKWPFLLMLTAMCKANEHAKA